MTFQHLLILHLTFFTYSYEKLSSNINEFDPRITYDGKGMKFDMGSVESSSSSIPHIEIPIGDGINLRVPKAFYHYSEQNVEANSDWGIPDTGTMLDFSTLLKNNRKDINGIYLPLPNMQPINLHFISQRSFEKGIDSSAYDNASDSALADAKRICAHSSERDCERALLRYHRTKTQSVLKQNTPLHQQLLDLGDLTSYSAVRDHDNRDMGVMVGLQGYQPLYVNAAINKNEDKNIRIGFSSPE
ncbi:hypothetical protein DICVIV_00501 [Dictyocaulus viviparus]|uniref:Uncharacterized protein n=1 Tax=Dictyocaulus viviparus TaxID=29172 RepID=A0A0D8YAZ7_DICVI|nr:hypothetical protein DICVIV_00501 [Dictyocaulus viviparus]